MYIAKLPQYYKGTSVHSHALNITANILNTDTKENSMYIQINTEHKTTCTLSFCLVSFQLKHFGERCFSTGVDQICFSFIAEKFPVTAPNGWEPVYRNKAFISLPPKNKHRRRVTLKYFHHT